MCVCVCVCMFSACTHMHIRTYAHTGGRIASGAAPSVQACSLTFNRPSSRPDVAVDVAGWCFGRLFNTLRVHARTRLECMWLDGALAGSFCSCPVMLTVVSPLNTESCRDHCRLSTCRMRASSIDVVLRHLCYCVAVRHLCYQSCC